MHHQQPGHYPPPPPLPADDRIKKGVRRGDQFPDPYDSQRAVAYAQQFLATGNGLMRAPVLAAIVAGLALLVLLQVTVGVVYALVVPVAIFIGLMGYLGWFAANRGRVEQSLAANRQVAGR
jgi:hypothetical protein